VRVFVCYSRAQFYFAEDLTLALRQRDVDAWLDVQRLEPGDDWQAGIDEALRSADAVLFCASRQALASPYAQRELSLARELGKPIVVTLVQGFVTLPPELRDAPRIDMRRAFEHKLGDLVAALHGRPFASSIGGPAAIVFVVSVALLIAAAACAVIGLRFLDSESNPDSALVAFSYFTYALACVWLVSEFVRRRPRRTTLIVIVLAIGGLVGAVATNSAFRLFLDGDAGDGTAVVFVCSLWMAAAALWASQSHALYRWLPTGDAPNWLRRDMLRHVRASGGMQPFVYSEITYAVHCHEVDASVGQEIDRALNWRPRFKAADDGDPAFSICVVSNLTPTAWLDGLLAGLSGRVVMVIAAPVPQAALHDFRRYQWVDYRRRRFDTLNQMASVMSGSRSVLTPDLAPENLSLRVLPVAVIVLAARLVLGAMVNFAVLVSHVVGTGTMGGGADENSSLVAAAPLLGIALPAAVAGLLVTRRVTPWMFVALFWISVFGSFIAVEAYWPDTPSWAVIEPVAIGGTLLVFTWSTVRRWLPRSWVPPGGGRVSSLDASWWRRPGTWRIVAATAVISGVFVSTALVAPRERQDPNDFAAATDNAARAAVTPDDELADDGRGYTLDEPAGWNDVTDEQSASDGVEYDRVYELDDQLAYVWHEPAEQDAESELLDRRRGMRANRLRIAAVERDVALDGEEQTAVVTFRERGPSDETLGGAELASVHEGVLYVVRVWTFDAQFARFLLAELVESWSWRL
jgi:hypothetical protein